MATQTLQGIDHQMLIRRAVTLARWRAAEDLIYPLITADPKAYMSAVRAITAASQHLVERYPTQDLLFDADPRVLADELHGDAAAGEAILTAVSFTGLNPVVVVEAALAHAINAVPRSRRDASAPLSTSGKE